MDWFKRRKERTIQYPVTSRKKVPEKHRELTWVYIGLINAVDTGGGCKSGMRPKDQDSG